MRVLGSHLLLLLTLAAAPPAADLATADRGPAPDAAASVTYYDSRAAFQAALPGLPLETFEEGDVAGGGTTVCGDDVHADTDDACWDPGDLIEGLLLTSWDPEELAGHGTAIFGAGAHGNTTIATGANAEGDVLLVIFPEYADGVGLDVFSVGGAETMTITLLDAESQIIDDYGLSVSTSGTFFGAVSTTPIYAVAVESSSDARELVDDLEVSYHSANLDLEVGGVEDPQGVVTLTIEAINHGPREATGVTVTGTLSSRLVYQSDDCSGTNGATWTWNVSALAAGASETCHLTAHAPQGGPVGATLVIDGAQPDFEPGNDTAFYSKSLAGPGPDTRPESFALYRSFPDVTLPTDTGGSFSFRANADKLLVVQVCAAWCGPCREWTDQGPELQTALTSAIGAGNFEIVDLLYQDDDGAPSTQADAAQWKNAFDFPGRVLHAAGSSSSALSKLFGELVVDYDEVGSLGIPYFFVLAPGCRNQIAARGVPGTIDLGEEVSLDTFTVDQVVDIATTVWNEGRCRHPVFHRLDRCSLGSTPVELDSSSGESISAAESFVVPDGGLEIESLHAVVEAEEALSFDVDIHADAAGEPGAVVCGHDGVASTGMHGTWVRRIVLPTRCVLGPGKHWLALAARNPSSQPLWRGGFLPPGDEFAFRDTADVLATGCTDWGGAGECLGPEAGEVRLCYDLEAAPDVFSDGFESNGTDNWSGRFPP